MSFGQTLQKSQMDNRKLTAARMKLAKGFLETAKINHESTECEVRNAFSRCYYSFFHLSHAVLGKYYSHNETPQRIAAIDARFGAFVMSLYRLRIDADYNPNVVSKEYNGDVAAYRLKAQELLGEAEVEFRRMLRHRRRKPDARRTT